MKPPSPVFVNCPPGTANRHSVGPPNIYNPLALLLPPAEPSSHPASNPLSPKLPLVVHIWATMDSQAQPWSNNPYAPQISRTVYLWEKENFAGLLIGAILHGTQSRAFFHLHPSHLLDLSLQELSLSCSFSVSKRSSIPSIEKAEASSGYLLPILWPCSLPPRYPSPQALTSNFFPTLPAESFLAWADCLLGLSETNSFLSSFSPRPFPTLQAR